MTGLLDGLRLGLRSARVTAHTVRHLARIEIDRAVDGESYAARDARVRRWAGDALASAGVEVVVDPSGPVLGPAPSGGRLLVANHRSMLDVLVILSRFGGHMLSRGDLAKWPVFGRLAAVGETLYVDRSNPTSGASSIRELSRQLSLGRTVTVFAEGTTHPDDAVRPFHPGAFVAALGAGAEVVPLGLAYADPHAVFFEETFGAHLTRLMTAPKTRVALHVGPSVDPHGLNAKRLAEATRTAVQAAVDDARRSL